MLQTHLNDGFNVRNLSQCYEFYSTRVVGGSLSSARRIFIGFVPKQNPSKVLLCIEQPIYWRDVNGSLLTRDVIGNRINTMSIRLLSGRYLCSVIESLSVLFTERVWNQLHETVPGVYRLNSTFHKVCIFQAVWHWNTEIDIMPTLSPLKGVVSVYVSFYCSVFLPIFSELSHCQYSTFQDLCIRFAVFVFVLWLILSFSFMVILLALE